MEKGARSCLGQVLATGGMQVTTGGMKVSTGGTQVARGRDAHGGTRAGGRVPKLSSPPSRSIYQAKIGSAM